MTTKQPSRYQPTVEALEQRSLLTTASLSYGVLRVFGSDFGEQIHLRQEGNQIRVEGVASFAASAVASVVVEGYGGNDIINLYNVRVSALIRAGRGDDFVIGTEAGDRILGGAGNDFIYGWYGNDVVRGGGGNDRLFGGEGYDYLFGQGATDFLDDGNRLSQELADGGAGYDFNADLWAVAGANANDIHQRGAPTCSFLSSLAAVSRMGVDFSQWIDYLGYDQYGTPQYRVWFRAGAGWTSQIVLFDGTLTSLDPASAAEGEFWTVLFQRAWIQKHGGDGRAWPHEALAALTGYEPVRDTWITDADQDYLRWALDNNRGVVAATRSSPHNSLIADHAYTVVSMWGSGASAWVLVRNPWGHDGGATTYGDPYDGYLWLSWGDFKASMSHGYWVA